MFGCRVTAQEKQKGNIGPIFAFLPPWGVKKLKFFKNKKTPRGIMILNQCAKNYDMMFDYKVLADKQRAYFREIFALLCIWVV